MSTYVNYTPSSAISRAMFNFDVYSGWQNFKTSGIVRVSVSDSFSYWDYLSPAYSDFATWTPLLRPTSTSKTA